MELDAQVQHADAQPLINISSLEIEFNYQRHSPKISRICSIILGGLNVVEF